MLSTSRPGSAAGTAKRVLTVNDLDDYARFRGTLTGKQSVAIVGAGLIGCEFANDLCGAGFRVELIDLAEQPLPRLLVDKIAKLESVVQAKVLGF